MKFNTATGTFSLLADLCECRFFKYLLLKHFKTSFFASYRADPQATLDIMGSKLFRSQNPAWSLQILELLSWVPNETLEANEGIILRFKSFGENQVPVIDQIIKAQSVLLKCFAGKSLNVNKSLVDHAEAVMYPSPDPHSMKMGDLLLEREKILGEWFVEHNLSGKAAKQDKSNFYRVVKKYAEAGDAKSQYILSLIYWDGFGEIEKNPEKSLDWLKASAAQHFTQSQCTLGYMHCLGVGVNQNSSEGRTWLETAARNGSKVAKLARSKQPSQWSHR